MQAVLAFLQRVWNVIKEYWQKTERKDRVRFIIISSVALICVIVVIALLTRVNYVVLYSEMEAADLGEVDSLLTTMNVKHRIEGSSILVPEELRDQLVASLAVQDFPKSGYTYELITENAAGFGVSESDKNMWYRIQREENLRTSIMINPLIRDARVVIAQPDNSGALYKSEVVPVTASVTLKLNDTLTSENIRAIQTMVSSSWPNLSPENVSVVDQYANLLSSIEPMEVDLLAAQEDLRLQVQNELERAMNAILVPWFGADHVRAKCKVTLDFNDVSSERITLSPVVDDEGIAVSRQRVTEAAVGSAGGSPVGEDANGGDDISLYDETTSVGDTWNMTSETINWEVNELIERITQAKGGITDLTASIIIDSNELSENNTNAESDVQAIVAGVLGLAREDYGAINVVVRPLDGIQSELQAYNDYLAELRRQEIFELIRALALYLVMGICMLVIIWRVFKLFHRGPSAEELLEMQRASEMEELDEYADLVKLAAAAEDIETSKTPERMKVEDFVERSPDMVANLLRNWLMEEIPGRRR